MIKLEKQILQNKIYLQNKTILKIPKLELHHFPKKIYLRCRKEISHPLIIIIVDLNLNFFLSKI